MRSRLKTIGATLLLSCLIVGAGDILSRVLQFASAIPLFLLPLLFIAWRLHFGPAVFACVVSTLTLDFFFTEPRGMFRVSSPQDIAALCSFLLVVLVVSHLSSRLALKAERLVERELAQRALHQLAERSLFLDWRMPIAEELCRAVRSCFGLEDVCLWDGIESRFASANPSSREDTVIAAYMAERDFDLPKTSQRLRMLRSGVRTVGSIQLIGRLPDASIIGSIVSLVSLTLERARALNGEVFAQSERTSEQLRTTVLDSLAHSIKTPLTTIAVSSAGAVAIGGLAPTQIKLLNLVEEQAHSIAALTDSLLKAAAPDTKLCVKPQPLDLSALVANVVRELDLTSEPGRVTVQHADPPIRLMADPALLRMAVLQVSENALKYSLPGSDVTILLQQAAPYASISIHNKGSYISPSEQKLVFKRFYRSPEMTQRAPGTGLGLSVASRSIEALGGEIFVESDQASGTTFTMKIPTGELSHARLNTDR